MLITKVIFIEKKTHGMVKKRMPFGLLKCYLRLFTVVVFYHYVHTRNSNSTDEIVKLTIIYVTAAKKVSKLANYA